MKVANPRAVTAAALLWCISVLWLWPRAVRAATLSAEAKVYDWESLAYAAGIGLAGGVLALIVALATEKRIVREVLSESLRNAMVSPIAGAGAYEGLKVATSMGWWNVSTELRFLAIGCAGYAGIAAIQWARDLAVTTAASLRDRILSKGANHDQ